MRGYERDEYEDLDEYETEGEEQEEEDGEDEEEVRPPTKDELEYLELRQRLKESIRKKMKKELGSVPSNSREKKSKIPNDSFGSFFGPSQPVIAQRVIQESKSLLENPQLAARVSNGNNSKNKAHASTPVRSKPQAKNHRPDVTSHLKKNTKIQMVKNTRDYSFLLSDDAELPAPAKDQPPRSVSAPKSGAHLAHRIPSSNGRTSSSNGRTPSSNGRTPSSNGRNIPSGREERKSLPAVNQMRAKVGSQNPASSNKPNVGSVDPRRQLGSNNASGPGRPLSKGMSSKSSMPIKEKVISVSGAKSSMPGVRKPLPVQRQSSVPKQHLEQRKDYRESNQKIMAKRPITASKPQPQIKQQPPKSSVRPTSQADRPKKRPARPFDDDDDDVAAISMIRNMFGYNPNKYRDDDDDSDMEANFDDIMKEERRSAKIAKQEDEEELRKIEEEERRERMRREAKKRKMSR